jgi:hypothetical protein
MLTFAMLMLRVATPATTCSAQLAWRSTSGPITRRSPLLNTGASGSRPENSAAIVRVQNSALLGIFLLLWARPYRLRHFDPNCPANLAMQDQLKIFGSAMYECHAQSGRWPHGRVGGSTDHHFLKTSITISTATVVK